VHPNGPATVVRSHSALGPTRGPPAPGCPCPSVGPIGSHAHLRARTREGLQPPGAGTRNAINTTSQPCDSPTEASCSTPAGCQLACSQAQRKRHKRGNGGQRFAKKAPRPGEPSLQTVAHRYGSHAVYCARCRALQRHIASTRRRAIGIGYARAHSSYAQAAPCELRRQARTC
jgi:hypothetical protein